MAAAVSREIGGGCWLSRRSGTEKVHNSGVTMTKPKLPPTPTDDEVRTLLVRYQCPVPFHAVRTRFLGNIATPAMQSAPMDTVAALWGGEIPVFESLDATNELIGALVMGLWNRLTRHQERSAPFRLTRIEVAVTREGMSRLALMRREELEGFIEGLFGDNDSLDFPERAHKALGVLAEIRAMLEGVREVADNPAKPASPADIGGTLGHLREFTRIMEHEMHELVLSCTRARRQMLEMMPAGKPVLH
jgi:hypothetical protein